MRVRVKHSRLYDIHFVLLGVLSIDYMPYLPITIALLSTVCAQEVSTYSLTCHSQLA
jgi:hypothetical protein